MGSDAGRSTPWTAFNDAAPPATRSDVGMRDEASMCGEPARCGRAKRARVTAARRQPALRQTARSRVERGGTVPWARAYASPGTDERLQALRARPGAAPSRAR